MKVNILLIIFLSACTLNLEENTFDGSDNTVKEINRTDQKTNMQVPINV